MATDVAALVSEMNDTLVDIRQTIDALATTTHSSRLDQLEHQRDSTIAALRANFERETDDLAVKRRRERDEIAERRRQEDEEIAARRRREDEDMGTREEKEDEERERRFVGETDDVEDEMDGLMEGVETEAETFLAEGRNKLAQLEERRKELNRLIDEQVRVPFPTVTTRRRSRNQRTMDAAITSKPAPTQATGEPVNNTLKAIKEGNGGGSAAQSPQQAGREVISGPGEEEDRTVSESANVSRGSFESSGSRRSRTASVSSSHRGSRMSAFGWIAGKIGLGEAREEDESTQEPEHISSSDLDKELHTAPEVPDRSPTRPSVANTVKVPRMSEEAVPEGPSSSGGKEDTEPTVEQTHKAQIHSSEVEIKSSELEPATILSATTPSHGTNDSDGVDESQEVGVAEHEDEGLFSGIPETREEARIPPVDTDPTNQPPDSTHHEPRSEYDQHDNYDVVYDEDAHDADVTHDHSTASSRAESIIETATALASSETTLEVDPEPHYEQDVVQRIYDKDNDGDFSSESQTVDNICVEDDGVGRLDVGSDEPEDASQSPVPTMETKDDVSGGEIPDSVDEGPSPSTHVTDQDGPMSRDHDRNHEHHESHANVNSTSRLIPVDGMVDEAQAVQANHQVPEVTDGSGTPASPGLPIQDETKPKLSHDRSSNYFSLVQGNEEGVLVLNHEEEQIHQADEGPTLPAPSGTEILPDTSEPTVSEVTRRPEPDENTVPDASEGYRAIELPPHVLEYSSAIESMQLPNGTWSVGMVDEELHASLVAQFMVPSVAYLEHGILEGPPPAFSVLEAPDPDAFSPEDRSNNAVVPPDALNGGEGHHSFVYASSAHDIQPVAVQLANGAWSINPSDREFEDALVLSQVSGLSAPAGIHSPDGNGPENGKARLWEKPELRSMVPDVQPVTMQLPNSTWVIDPSEREYDFTAAQAQQPFRQAEHVLPSMSTPASPTSYSRHETPSKEVFPLSPVQHFPHETGLPEVSEADSPPRQQVLSAPYSKTEDRDGNMSFETTESPSESVLPSGNYQQGAYGDSQAALRDGASLPWSPFNSRMPLSPDSPPEATTHSPHLDEPLELERAEDKNIASVADRHATFGYGKSAAELEEHEYPVHDMPENPYLYADMLNVADPTTGRVEDKDTANLVERHATFGYGKSSAEVKDHEYPVQDMPENPYLHADMLNIAEPTTDTDSQNFVTPLQSAGTHTPPPFQDTSDAFRTAVDYAQGDVGQEETATTVHGQDELFDSDSMSEYEPDPGVDENGDPRPNLGMPPQHHALSHADEAVDTPTTAILQPAGEDASKHTTDMPLATEDNSDVSPLSLREPSPPPVPPRRGLAFSRHNPERPITPPAQTIPEDIGSHRGSWDASGPVDSTPMSLVSHSTLSSSPDSPVRERMHEGHEPEIQNSWSEEIHGHEYAGEYQPTPAQEPKFEDNLPTPIATHMPDSVRDRSPATPSPSSLIQKMRGIFENAGSSPVRSRPSSGIFNASRPPESPGYDVPGEPRKGGFLNEAEDEVDERSALLGSVGKN